MTLMTLFGRTDGSSTTGTFSLYGDLLYSTADYVRIPKGIKAKIWCKRISGEVETEVIIQFTNDVTETTPTWNDVSRQRLASKGVLELEKRRPVVLRGRTGKEAFRITWDQTAAGAGYANVEIEVELVEED